MFREQKRKVLYPTVRKQFLIGTFQIIVCVLDCVVCIHFCTLIREFFTIVAVPFVKREMLREQKRKVLYPTVREQFLLEYSRSLFAYWIGLCVFISVLLFGNCLPLLPFRSCREICSENKSGK